MNKWETAKAKLDDMKFPGQALYGYTEKHRSNEDINGITKSSRRHRTGKTSHPGMSVKVSGLMTLDGHGTEFIRDYCLKCKRETKLQGTVFNTGTNSCYVRVFSEDKQGFDENDLVEFMGSLN